MIKKIKRLIFLIILFFAVIGFVFIFNPGNVSPISLPCPSACGNDICGFKAVLWKGVSCELNQFSGCSWDCRMRNFRCNVDLELQEPCVDCINNCLQSFDQNDSQENQLIDECKKECFQ